MALFFMGSFRHSEVRCPVSYLPALRLKSLSWAYDPIAMRIVRSGQWRPAVVAAAAPGPGERVLDLGCGTGTLCAMLKRHCPDAEIIGVDPDPAMLARAREKAATCGLAVTLLQGSATALPSQAPLDRAVDTVVSSLMFHHLPRAGKRAALAEAYRLLRPGGKLVLADWGPPETLLGRVGFGVTQIFDGFETTRDHARRAFPALIGEAGFDAVGEAGRWPTAVGVLCLYSALKPRGPAS